MCGRYALALRPAEVRRQLQEARMPSEEAPDDDDIRPTYNFAPGYYGLVYRADTPDTGAGSRQDEHRENDGQEDQGTQETVRGDAADGRTSQEPRYKLQAMKWGLIPFWTKRNPDYGSMLKTINCRDDSLIENRGMWNTMKQRKRCIVIAQGFYEWLKKNGGKEKVPHFVKRKDGQLMCFAGLWDCVKYEGSEEKLYTYTIITTDSNKQLKFLHDRMPVILDNGSEAIRTWLDPNRVGWSKELQSLLKPYDGELEIYPVSKEVGKVGNNSPSFIVPLDSTENKSNIANFFGNQKAAAKGKEQREGVVKLEEDLKEKGTKTEKDSNETRVTTNDEGTEDNAPLPKPPSTDHTKGIKREHEAVEDDGDTADVAPEHKVPRISTSDTRQSRSPEKSTRRIRSATSNGTAAKNSPAKKSDGSQKITAFFGK
ncbi:hypothetical protein H2199_005722 [Coniosporium tulheliwenetii]|uniref:Uncharacterized protein n=1 Tax=Coniosporium tulheliwenetii TaxID=3383036 RepID=A0ACC2Z0Z6_9PEZI|nr:hypothetical protein H2199_005722 [Cladosporium sp. JES 115]